jgi:hypothetical protein
MGKCTFFGFGFKFVEMDNNRSFLSKMNNENEKFEHNINSVLICLEYTLYFMDSMILVVL